MRNIIVILLVSLVVGGCASTQQKKAERWKMLTPNNPSLVFAEARISEPRKYYEFELETWQIRYVSNSLKDHCVQSLWQLFEFENQTEQGWVFVPAGGKVEIGYMVQSPWEYDGGTYIDIDPVGLLKYVHLAEPSSDTCSEN